VKADSGSIIPLGIGAISLSLLVSLLFAELTGVEIQKLRNKQLSDVLVLKIATDLRKNSIPPLIGLDYSPVLQDLSATTSKVLKFEPTQISVESQDGKTMEGKVCSRWKSITGLSFDSFGFVCSTSKARAIS
jgi:hypothetical protein